MTKYFLLFLLLLALTEAQSQTLKIVTYNIRLDTEADGVNAWPERKQKVFDVIKKYSPDVLGVQEALHHQLQELVQNLPEYGYVGVGRDDGKEKGEYSAILFKRALFEVLDHDTFWLSETPDVPGSKSWDAAITRVASWAKFRVKATGKEFVTINTHFDHIGKEARAKSAGLLATTVDRLGKDTPLILTGDLNFTRDDKPYAVLMSGSSVELKDPAPANPPGTSCTFEVGKIECNAIDYILVTPRWRIEEYQVITDNDGRYYPSDHLPVMVSVILPEK